MRPVGRGRRLIGLGRGLDPAGGERGQQPFFDPLPAIEKASIPVLAFFGELDRNVDPVQGTEAFRKALEKTGDRHSRVVLFPEVDHDMVPSRTGCLKERNERSDWRAHPGYLETMIEWLGGTTARR